MILPARSVLRPPWRRNQAEHPFSSVRHLAYYSLGLLEPAPARSSSAISDITEAARKCLTPLIWVHHPGYYSTQHIFFASRRRIARALGLFNSSPPRRGAHIHQSPLILIRWPGISLSRRPVWAPQHIRGEAVPPTEGAAVLNLHTGPLGCNPKDAGRSESEPITIIPLPPEYQIIIRVTCA